MFYKLKKGFPVGILIAGVNLIRRARGVGKWKYPLNWRFPPFRDIAVENC